MKAVIQLDQRGRRFGGISRAVVLMLEQQGTHVHGPLGVHHGEALAEDHRLQQGADLENIMDILGRGAGDLNALSGVYGDQLILRQSQNGLPHRCAAQFQQLLELGFIDKLSGGQVLLKDHGLDLVVRDLRQAFPLLGRRFCHKAPPAVIYQMIEKR